MKKIALVFLLAVFAPSLMLAWLAVRSIRDQQLILERQQFLLYQGVADSLAKAAENFLAAQQHEFSQQVEALIAKRQPAEMAPLFDDQLRAQWPLAEVGFVVTMNGDIRCPTTPTRPAAKTFLLENTQFLCNAQPAEVYWNSGRAGLNTAQVQAAPNASPTLSQIIAQNELDVPKSSYYTSKNMIAQKRSVVTQQPSVKSDYDNNEAQYSKVAPSEAEFRQLIGDSTEGSVARFLENKLNVLLWYRSSRDSNFVFGALLSLPRLKQALTPMLQELEPALKNDIAVALLDDTARPVALSRAGFRGNWKHPFAATEVGETLPHWEMSVYLLNPAKLAESARSLKLTLGLLIVVLLLAIGIGGWLIFTDLGRHLTLARQKTDFVSNVSHELKTPLTSIRMFSELLAENRVTEPEKRQSYLNIITAETSRLTRLINNVLDFSRMERGEKKYNFTRLDLVALIRETVETYRPHLESNGFTVQCELAASPILLEGDRDALAQVVVNLLSNAEKYSDGQKEITLQVEQLGQPLPYVEVRILDRGTGVPRGCEEKIFEQFYRAHDSLSSGIQGSGLGLTLARQIARAHSGDVVFGSRDGRGSCFTLRLPIPPDQANLI